MASGWRYWCSGCCCVFVELCNWCFSFSLFSPEEVKSESAHGHPHLTPTGDAGPWKPCREAPSALFLFWCWCCRRFEAWQVLSQQSVGGFNAPCASLTSCGWTAVAPEHFHFVITGGGGRLISTAQRAVLGHAEKESYVSTIQGHGRLLGTFKVDPTFWHIFSGLICDISSVYGRFTSTQEPVIFRLWFVSWEQNLSPRAEAQQNDTSAWKCDDRKCGWPGISMWSAQKQHFPNAETQNISQTQTRNVAAKFWLLSSSLLKCRFKPQSWMGWGFAATDIKLPSASLLELWRTFTALRGFLCDEARPVHVPVSLHSCSHVVYQGSHYCTSAWTSCQAPGYQPGHVLALLPLQRNELYSLHCRVFSCVSAQVSTNAGETNPPAFTFICFCFPLKEFVS